MSSMSELNIGEKLKLIKEHESVAISERELARKFKISKSQVHRILKNKDSIKKTLEKIFMEKKALST